MTDRTNTPGDKARAFWEEQACRFDDHWPLISQLLRDRGYNAWLAGECDRLTAELKALQSESADTNAVEKGPATERPGVDSGALQSLTSAAKSSTTPSSAALRTCARCKVSWTAPVEACPECGPMRWVPVSDSIVIRHIQVINPALPIYARAESGQWFRLDGLLQLTVGEPE